MGNKKEFDKDEYLKTLNNLSDKELLKETKKVCKSNNKEKADLILLVATIRLKFQERRA